MKILIGTQNRSKQRDFGRSIQHAARQKSLDIELVFPQDENITEDVDETGKTFAENSELKARYYFEKAYALTNERIPTISDDGGIIIPVLGENIPGVHSKRWAGENATDQEIIDFTLKKLEKYPNDSDRATMFQTYLTYYDGKHLIQATGKTIGHTSQTQKPGPVMQGFPYRSIFILPNGKYYTDLTQEEHDQYNHRDEAVRKLLDKISSL